MYADTTSLRCFKSAEKEKRNHGTNTHKHQLGVWSKSSWPLRLTSTFAPPKNNTGRAVVYAVVYGFRRHARHELRLPPTHTHTHTRTRTSGVLLCSPAAPPTRGEGVELYVAVLSCAAFAAGLGGEGRAH